MDYIRRLEQQREHDNEDDDFCQNQIDEDEQIACQLQEEENQEMERIHQLDLARLQ